MLDIAILCGSLIFLFFNYNFLLVNRFYIKGKVYVGGTFLLVNKV
jgi:hypothetical protein